jgi:hypothetical protein
MARDKQTQLDDVDSAISAIENGAQSYTLAEGRTVTKANLKTLYEERKRLDGIISRQSGVRTRVYSGRFGCTFS